MKPLKSTFGVNFDPVANPEAQVISGKVRFSLLTARLLRLEFSPDGRFEDRPSQTFWVRNLPVPEFELREDAQRLEIETHYLLLAYKKGQDFSIDSLRITLKESGEIWHYGARDPFNLRGTARTLDNVDGALELEEGLLSRSGWFVYDDSSRLVFDEQAWLKSRQSAAGYQDLMFFGYGSDFPACLSDFSMTGGPAPMIPRWALGNWWSRYWAYADQELLGVIDEFIEHGVPLSVCIVDMDWHLVQTGNLCSGWTGYTWNRDLFPDPPAFIAALHERGIKTALNLHPAEGVHDHEAAYAAMCARLGVDPKLKQPVPFDIADPQFARAYFELLHHPQEEDGVDFWWIDWQQGTDSSLSGLDPLFWLNHLHFYDLARNGDRRPFIFSRWGGLGNHRMPIGFSGDAVVTWDSLAFQPYFTATAANVNYGWWSHDIGGHMGGYEEPQLYTRWVQFGVFSPILRLHSTNNPFHERRPWGWDAETERVAARALRLRHRLIPYLYSMAWRNHVHSQPLVRPMYHGHAGDEQAYHCPDQYYFGSELIAAPFLEPLDADTRLSRQVVWLPPGEWFGFFDGLSYTGDGWQAIYGSLDDIPVFARAGAIIPLAPAVGWGGIRNPEIIEVHLFPGADNEFQLYEDNGLDQSSITPLRQRWTAKSWQVKIGPLNGLAGHLPPKRTYQLLFRGLIEKSSIAVHRNGKELSVAAVYDHELNGMRVAIPGVVARDEVVIGVTSPQIDSVNARLANCRKVVRAARIESRVKLALDKELAQIGVNPWRLEKYELHLTRSQIRALVEISSGSGFHRREMRSTKGETIIFWNNQETEDVRYKLVALDANNRTQMEKGPLPRFAVISRDHDKMTYHIGTHPTVGQISLDSWLESLPGRLRPQQIKDLDLAISFQVQGARDHSATLVIENGRPVLVRPAHEAVNATISANMSDWLALINGKEKAENLFVQGKIQLHGDMALVLRLAEVFDIVSPGIYQPEGWRLTVDFLDVLRVPIS